MDLRWFRLLYDFCKIEYPTLGKMYKIDEKIYAIVTKQHKNGDAMKPDYLSVWSGVKR